MPRAFITGVTGQDGSYLAEWLLGRNYEVHGTTRPGSGNRARFEDIPVIRAALGRSLHLHPLAETGGSALQSLLREVAPAEFYHLAGQSSVTASFADPVGASDSAGLGAARALETLRRLPQPPRSFFASSAHVFGRPQIHPQNEQTPFAPVTPYGCAKAFATQMVRVYRESFGLFAASGIMYNHESPRRAEGFVGRKICRAAAAIKLGLQKELALGDRRVVRDWGHARDYARAMWLMLQQPAADDYVLATGQRHSVQEFVECAFRALDLDWQRYVVEDPKLFRAGEPDTLAGDASKAARLLGWKPETSFQELVREMTFAELEALSSTPSAQSQNPDAPAL